MVAIVARGRRLLRDRDDGCGFEAHQDNSLAQQGVKYACEDICELLSKISQDTTRNIVRTRGFPGVGPSDLLMLSEDQLKISLKATCGPRVLLWCFKVVLW